MVTSGFGGPLKPLLMLAPGSCWLLLQVMPGFVFEGLGVFRNRRLQSSLVCEEL